MKGITLNFNQIGRSYPVTSQSRFNFLTHCLLFTLSLLSLSLSLSHPHLLRSTQTYDTYNTNNTYTNAHTHIHAHTHTRALTQTGTTDQGASQEYKSAHIYL